MRACRVVATGLTLAFLSACATQVPVGDKTPGDNSSIPAAVTTVQIPAEKPPSLKTNPQDQSLNREGLGANGVIESTSIAARIAAAKKSLEKIKPSIYFGFDSFDIKPEYQTTLSVFANYLQIDDKAKLIIEGNADERGTPEYNLALGQKRSESVRKSLGALGIAANRVEAISNGEEKPRAKGSNETAWAENRRADMVLK